MGADLGIRELRADLAAVVRRAGAGQRTVVSVGGTPVAQIGPLQSDGAAATLAELIATGAVVAPRRTDAARPAPPIPIWSGVRLDRALKDVRG